MCLRQIPHMDEIPHAGVIGCRVIGPEDRHAGTCTGRAQHVGDQVRFRLVASAKLPAGAGGVEVAL